MNQPVKLSHLSIQAINLQHMKNLINEFCKNHNLTEDQFYGKKKIFGNLYLQSVTSLPENFNPTVGGDLYLHSITSLPENFNPTVGRDLDLQSVLKGNYIKIPENAILTWQDGKYILADGILTEVIKKRGNVYRVKKVGTENIIYLITDGQKWSHGETLKEAKEDLIYKTNNRKKEDYSELKLTDQLNLSDAITCYRVITGACAFGTKDFVQTRLRDKKKIYTISEIIELTKGEYGNQFFSHFFKNK